MTRKKNDGELLNRREGAALEEWKRKNGPLYNYYRLKRYNHLLGYVEGQVMPPQNRKERMDYGISIGNLN